MIVFRISRTLRTRCMCIRLPSVCLLLASLLQTDYKKNFTMKAKISYDATNKRVREVEEVDVGADREFYDVLYLYNEVRSHFQCIDLSCNHHRYHHRHLLCAASPLASTAYQWGLFPCLRGFGRMFEHSFPACPVVFFLFFF